MKSRNHLQNSVRTASGKASFEPGGSFNLKTPAAASLPGALPLPKARSDGDDLGLRSAAMPTLDAISRVRECAEALFQSVDERYGGVEVRRMRLALSVLDQNAYSLRENLHQAHIRVKMGDDAVQSENARLRSQLKQLQDKCDALAQSHDAQAKRLAEADTVSQSQVDASIARQKKQWEIERASLVETYEKTVADETKKRREAENRALELEEKADASEAKYQDCRQAVEILKGEIMGLQSNNEVTVMELHSKLEVAHQKLRLRSKGLVEQDRLRSGFDNGLFEHLEGLTEKYTRAQTEIDQASVKLERAQTEHERTIMQMEADARTREAELEEKLRAAAMEHQKAVHTYELAAEKSSSQLAAAQKEATGLLNEETRYAQENAKLERYRGMVPELQASTKLAEDKARNFETQVSKLSAENASQRASMDECVASQRRLEVECQMARGELQRAKLELDSLRAQSRSVDAHSSHLREAANATRAQVEEVEEKLMQSVRERDLMHSQTTTYQSEVAELKQKLARSDAVFEARGFRSAEHAAEYHREREALHSATETKLQACEKEVASLTEQLSRVRHEKDIEILKLEKQVEAASNALKVKLGAMDREIASSRDIAAAEFNVREAKLRQEMELAAAQHANTVQLLRAEAAGLEEQLAASKQNIRAIKEDYDDRLKRQQSREDEIDNRRAASQRELNLATRDVAAKEFKIEKLTLEVEDLRSRLKQQDSAHRAEIRERKESGLDLEREITSQRRTIETLESQRAELTSQIEDLEQQQKASMQHAERLNNELATLREAQQKATQLAAEVITLKSQLSESAQEKERLEKYQQKFQATSTELEEERTVLAQHKTRSSVLEVRVRELEGVADATAEELAAKTAQLASARSDLQRTIDEITEIKAQHTVHSAEVQSQLKERESTFEIMVQTQANQQRLLQQEAEAAQQGLADEIADMEHHQADTASEIAGLRDTIAALKSAASVAEAEDLVTKEELAEAQAAATKAQKKYETERSELSDEKVRRLTEQEKLTSALSEAKAALHSEKSKAEKLLLECLQKDSKMEIQEAIAAESQHLQAAAVEAESVMLERIHALEEVSIHGDRWGLP